MKTHPQVAIGSITDLISYFEKSKTIDRKIASRQDIKKTPVVKFSTCAYILVDLHSITEVRVTLITIPDAVGSGQRDTLLSHPQGRQLTVYNYFIP